MSTANSVVALRRNVRRMLDLMPALGDPEWLNETRRRLRWLDDKLAALLLGPVRTIPPDVEVEFYSIVERHSILRKAARVVFAQELVEICEHAIAHYEQLGKERRLSRIESNRFDNVRAELETAKQELQVAHQELLHGAEQ